MAATRSTARLWPARKIPYEPFDKHPERDAIRDAMRWIEENSRISFSPRTGAEPNWVVFKNDDVPPNWSDTIGMRTTPGPQFVDVDKGSGRAALHELFHVIGYIHEQQRKDRDDYLRDIPDPTASNIAIDQNAVTLTPYDRESVMQYTTENGSGRWAADPSLPLGPQDLARPSTLDLAGIEELYAPSTGWSWPFDLGVLSWQRPGIAWHEGRLFAMVAPGDGGLRYSSSPDGDAWSLWDRLEGAGTRHGPALASLDGKLYAAWNGYHDDGVFYSVREGNAWSGQQRIEQALTRDSPALAVYDGRLYAAWLSKTNNSLLYTYLAPQGWWMAPSTIPGAWSRNGPTLAAFEGRLYAAWNGEESDGIWYASFDGSAWSPVTRLPQGLTVASPALATYVDPWDRTRPALYAAWRGKDASTLWWATFDGKEWSGEAHLKDVPRLRSATALSLASSPDQLWMGWATATQPIPAVGIARVAALRL